MRTVRTIYLTLSILGLVLMLIGLAPQPVAASTLSGFTATPTNTVVPPTATFTPVPPTLTPTPNAPQPTQPPPPPQPEPPPLLLPETGADNAPDANMGDIDLVIIGSLLLTTGLVMRAKYVRRNQTGRPT